MRLLVDCLLLLGAAVTVNCQYSDDFGPAPPRLLIPGAVPLGPAPSAPRRPVPRLQARRQQVAPPPEAAPQPTQRLRSRPANGRAGRLPLQPSPQPILAPSPPPQQFFSPSLSPVSQRPLQQLSSQEDAPIRPVIEDTEDDYEEDPGPFSPAPVPTTPPPPPPPPPVPQRPVFRPERPALLPTPAPELNFVSPPRQQPRPAPSYLPDDDSPRKLSRADQAYNSRNKPRPTPVAEDPQFSRQYNRAQSVIRAPQKQAYNSPAKQDYERPLKAQRPRKPVAQVLRRYREENEDGSITWGYENDDGSFKEETIGTDCVTYGKYGYIDPDGTRREYTYSTGVLCNKEKDSQDQASEGYIDYAENKYVLPNGDSIDLNKMVKNRARKPIQNVQYRN